MARRTRRAGGSRAPRALRHAEDPPDSRVRESRRTGQFLRTQALRRPPRNRKAHKGRLHLLDVVEDGRLQGTPPRNADGGLLPRPVRPRLRIALRDRPPEVLDEHLPELAARPPLPRARPQRRDKHAQGQPQRPLRPRTVARLAPLRRRPEEDTPAHPGGAVRFRLAGQHVRASRRSRPRRTACDDDADAAGVGGELPHGTGRARLLRIPLRAHGAVGRTGRDRLHGRRKRRRDARPQRTQARTVDPHQVGALRARLRGRRPRHPVRRRRAARTPPPRRNALAGPRRAPPRRGCGAQELLRPQASLPPLGRREQD